MLITKRILLVIVSLCLITGCAMLNDTTLLDDNKVDDPSRNRSVLIFGMAVEGVWHYPQFGLSLDEYDVEKKKITGTCWRYNHVKASVPKDSAITQYFAFDVAPGHYIFSGFNGKNLRNENIYFIPKGKLVYIGDFVYAVDGKVILRRDFATTSSILKKRFTKLMKEIVLAEATFGFPSMFLCAP